MAAYIASDTPRLPVHAYVTGCNGASRFICLSASLAEADLPMKRTVPRECKINGFCSLLGIAPSKGRGKEFEPLRTK